MQLFESGSSQEPARPRKRVPPGHRQRIVRYEQILGESNTDTLCRNTLIQVDKQLNQIATRDEMRQVFQEYQAPSQAPSKARAVIFMVDFDRDTKSLVSRENIPDSISRGFGSGNHVALWGLGGVG